MRRRSCVVLLCLVVGFLPGAGQVVVAQGRAPAQWCLPAPALEHPEDGATEEVGSNHFYWEAVPDAQGYEIEIIPGGTWTTEEPYLILYPEALTAGTYTWRVRACGVCGDGAWSPTRTLFMRFYAPELYTPADGARQRASQELSFTWEGSERSEFQIATAADFAMTVVSEIIYYYGAYTLPGDSLSAGTYYWRVRSWARYKGYSEWSEVRTFRLAAVHVIYLPYATGGNG